MRRVFLFLAIILFVSACTPKQVQVTVINPSTYDRTQDMVSLAISDLQQKLPLSGGEAYLVKNAQNTLVPSQVTHEGQLIFQANVKANDTTTFVITAGAKKTYKPKTHGRAVPERKDDFAWENDRVAFRIYGPALVAVDGPSNGIDLWYKRTSELVIDKWYKNDIAGVASYHEDHGEGMDNYKVGRSLGAGAMAPFVKDTLWLNSNYVSQAILDNGPLRTTFKLEYNKINVDGVQYGESRTISIDAGSQFSKVVQEYTGVAAPMQVAAGLVGRESGVTKVNNGNGKFLTIDEPETPESKNVFLGLVFPNGIDKIINYTYKIGDVSYSHELALTKYYPNKPVVYYTGYGWEKFGFPNSQSFYTYTSQFSNSLQVPLIVSVK